MNIISRSEWNARAPRDRATTSWSNRTGFVVHHSAGPANQSIKAIQNYHMDSRGWDDIGYNFLITPDGKVYEGCGWTVIGAHVAGHNTSNIGVCVVGNYTTTTPSTAVKNALAALYAEANRHKGSRLTIRTHRQLAPTACPGDKLHAWVASSLADHDTGGTPGEPSKPGTGTPAPGPAVNFPLPPSHYFGPRNGPDHSVSGFYNRKFAGKTDRVWLQTWTKQLQRRGWNIGTGRTYLGGSGNDGLFGPEYERLVKAFQRDQHLAEDGRLGPNTWAAAYRNPIS